MDVKIEPSWKKELQPEFSKPYFEELTLFLKMEMQAGKTMYPAGGKIFYAFDQTPFEEVKLVLLGQDPYHGAGQAMGLSFSVPKGKTLPPSLQNIYKELKTDLGIQAPRHGDLTDWAQQGVLLLNTSLTVRAAEPGSHAKAGWWHFTDAVIKTLSAQKQNLVFILWGKHAQEKKALIQADKHLIIESAHPSPYSADKGFFGSRPFSRANEYLAAHGIAPIDWKLHE